MQKSGILSKIFMILEIILIIGGMVIGLLAAVERYNVGTVASDGFFAAATETAEGKKLSISEIITYVLPIVIYIIVAFYGFVGYKEAHGDSIRIIMFTLAAAMALLSATGMLTVCGYVLPCCAVVAAYISGRLNKLRKNIPLIIFVSVLLLAFCIAQFVMFPHEYIMLAIGLAFSPFIQWASIVIAYIVRYDEHKLAGKQ